ncbi:sodium channel subunit beta-4-like isoform X5 [Scyliorhinus canicula]|uniref:sodium channel subunit beta-4-like isoform X5 n=1 Tax=Scyliorhinus canicula TaxID=7830 RepID=UPI0018F3D459|nr:sodium channel subunit beta-4-like isoform X5 [Scyliorhinus canicula]
MDGKQLQGHNLHKLLLLLLNVVDAVSGDSPVPVSGYLGEQVVLPCTYKGNVPVSDLHVIWGISLFEILHKFVDGNDDLTEQDARFRNRTTLFKDQLEQGNWSVLISDLRKSDQNKYECQIYKKKEEVHYLLKSNEVHLSVTERTRTPGPNTPVPGKSVSKLLNVFSALTFDHAGLTGSNIGRFPVGKLTGLGL